MTGRIFHSLSFAALLGCLTVSASGYSLLYSMEAPPSGLRWKGRVVKIALSSSLIKPSPNIKSDSDVMGAIRRSFASWEAVANIDIEEVSSERLNVSPAGNSGDGVSLITIAPTAENVLLFARDGEDVSARTRVFFSSRGHITEADIVLNPYQQFSTDGTFGTFDLESILTHEIGHLLGLDHSIVLGATMHDNTGKNGIYGLQNFNTRTLSDDDIASVRALYGPRLDDGECCGSIKGKITLPTGRTAKNFQVWLTEKSTGKVISAGFTSADGSFDFIGLTAGFYILYAQDGGNSKRLYGASSLGEVEIVAGETVTLSKKLAVDKTTVDIRYLGFNWQLAKLAVPVNGDRAFTVFFGGRELDSKKIKIGSASPFFNITPQTINGHDFGDNISVVSFEIRLRENPPPGEYPLYVESESGERRYLIGGISVDEFTM